MVKLSNEIKNQIIEDLKNKVSYKDIINSRNVSKATIYRINKELKNNNNIYEDNTHNNVNKTIITDTDTIISNKSYEFDINKLKEELNNDSNTIINQKANVGHLVNDKKIGENNIKNHNATSGGLVNMKDNSSNDDSDSSYNSEENVDSEESSNSNDTSNSEESSYSKESPEVIIPTPEKTNKQISKPLNESFSSHKSIKINNNINNNKPIIDKECILDTIKNCNTADSIEELKEIRSTVIIIRQYINTFEKELKNIWAPNKQAFEKKLFNLKLNELQVILENIRVENSLSQNREMFNNIVHTSLIGLEKISGYLNYNVDGLTNDLIKDPSFQYDMKILSCEIDMSRYINTKSSMFIKVVKKMYEKQKENQMKEEINKIIDNEEVLQKIKNIKK